MKFLFVFFSLINLTFALESNSIDSTNYMINDPMLGVDSSLDYINFKYNEAIPMFIAPKLSGGIFKLSDYCGDVNKSFKFKRYIKAYNKDPRKYILLSFFASYCQPCKHELPQLIDTYKQLKNIRDDIKLVLIGMDAKKDDINSFVQLYLNNDIPDDVDLLYNPSRNNMAPGKLYNVQKLPTLFLINKDGRVILEHVGYQEDYRLMEKIRLIFNKYETFKN